jgi:glucose-6-phosphate 1-epimerase
MNDLDQLNGQFGIQGRLVFVEGPGGMPVAELYNDLGEAAIALQGAHVIGFRARGQQPLIWMSDAANFAPGKSLRGGVPICWPWFGPHATDASLPGHGPARTADWRPVGSQSLDDGRTRLSLELVSGDAIRRQCPHPLRVQLHVTVGYSLRFALETTNLGETPFELGDALHTYFLVGDVRKAGVEGLDACTYIDKVNGGARKLQSGPVTIAGEADRIYLDTGTHLAIADPVMRRRILIDSEGSSSVVVWNPWVDKAEKMGDLGPHGYLRMLCVETANAADDVVQLAPGAVHRLVAEYSCQPQ